MLFLSDMLVGYNCVDVDHFFVFLCHSHSVIPQMCFSLQRLGRFFRAVCSGWLGFYLPLTPLPSWADRGWPAPSLPSPWSALWPVSLTQNNSGIKQYTGVISYILKKFWHSSESAYFLCSSTLNEAMKHFSFCNLPQDVYYTELPPKNKQTRSLPQNTRPLQLLLQVVNPCGLFEQALANKSRVAEWFPPYPFSKWGNLVYTESPHFVFTQNQFALGYPIKGQFTPQFMLLPQRADSQSKALVKPRYQWLQSVILEWVNVFFSPDSVLSFRRYEGWKNDVKLKAQDFSPCGLQGSVTLTMFITRM